MEEITIERQLKMARMQMHPNLSVTSKLNHGELSQGAPHLSSVLPFGFGHRSSRLNIPDDANTISNRHTLQFTSLHTSTYSHRVIWRRSACHRCLYVRHVMQRHLLSPLFSPVLLLILSQLGLLLSITKCYNVFLLKLFTYFENSAWQIICASIHIGWIQFSMTFFMRGKSRNVI